MTNLWSLQGHGVYSRMFYTERLRPMIQPIALSYTIFDRNGTPFAYLILTDGNLFT